MKTTYLYAAIIAAVIGGVILWSRINKTNDNFDISDSLSPTSVSTSSPQATTTAALVKQTVKPTPGIVVSEVASYKDWVKWLDPQNRRLALDKDCTSIVPSQVDYPNNVEIMLDNTASTKSRILKIGGREYSLDAKGWIITTLHSDNLPAKLTIFCGDMELGQLDLLAK